MQSQRLGSYKIKLILNMSKLFCLLRVHTFTAKLITINLSTDFARAKEKYIEGSLHFGRMRSEAGVPFSRK